MFNCKISLPFKNANTASPEDCAFDVNYPPPLFDETLIGKVSYTFDTDITANQTRFIATIPHNLGYIPFFYCQMIFGDSFASNVPATQLPYFAGVSNFIIRAYANSQNLYIVMLNPNGFTLTKNNLTYYFKYYISHDEGI